MKQILAPAVLCAAILINGCCCCKCRQTAPLPLQEEEIIETQVTKQETFRDVTVTDTITETEVITPSGTETIETEVFSMSQILPVDTVAVSSATVKPATPAAHQPKSYVNSDGRYLHPWMANPIIPGGQEKHPAPWSNEEMQFGVHYSFVRAGTAYIKTLGVTNTDFGPAYKIETEAKSAKVIDSVFKVRDFNYSWISVKDYSSYGYAQSIREGSYVRDEWVTFNTPKKEYKGIIKKKGEPNLIQGTLPGPVQDMLTSLYYVRMQDFSQGKDVILDVANRDKVYPMVVKFIKREKVKVPAGKFDCIVVEPGIRGEGIFIQKGKSLRVWLTDDERRIPVKMETEVFIGSVSASLEEYKTNK